jgi:hypothetical protein
VTHRRKEDYRRRCRRGPPWGGVTVGRGRRRGPPPGGVAVRGRRREGSPPPAAAPAPSPLQAVIWSFPRRCLLALPPSHVASAALGPRADEGSFPNPRDEFLIPVSDGLRVGGVAGYGPRNKPKPG